MQITNKGRDLGIVVGTRNDGERGNVIPTFPAHFASRSAVGRSDGRSVLFPFSILSSSEVLREAPGIVVEPLSAGCTAQVCGWVWVCGFVGL